MNKFLLGFLLLSAGVPGFLAVQGAAERARAERATRDREWRAASERLAESDRAAAGLRDETRGKQKRLRLATSGAQVSPELLHFLEGGTPRKNSLAWSEMRERLGIGWDSSADYVLVNKSVLKQLHLDAISYHVNDEICEVLAISPDERGKLDAAIKDVSALVWSHVQQAQPSGDILAQYTLPPDPTLPQSISNNFSAAVVGTLGPERADVFLDDGLRSVQGHLYPIGEQAFTMTFTRTEVDGQPALNFQWTEGDKAHEIEVQYSHGASSWVGALFPGGWADAAQRGGFQLPQRALYHPPNP